MIDSAWEEIPALERLRKGVLGQSGIHIKRRKKRKPESINRILPNKVQNDWSFSWESKNTWRAAVLPLHFQGHPSWHQRSTNTAGSHIHRYFTDVSITARVPEASRIPSNEFPLVIPEQMTTYLGSKVPYRGTRGTQSRGREIYKRHTGFRQINW